MGFFSIADISSSGMSAEQIRMDLIADNIANSETTRTSAGGPYQRKAAVFEAGYLSPFATMFSGKLGRGVRVSRIAADESEPRMVYDPNHPDSNQNGYVAYPNINVVNEMVDMMSATRAYEANLTMFNLAKNMAIKSLDIGR